MAAKYFFRCKPTNYRLVNIYAYLYESQELVEEMVNADIKRISEEIKRHTTYAINKKIHKL